MPNSQLAEKLDDAEQEFYADIAMDDCPNWADGLPADAVADVLAQEYETRCRFRAARDSYMDAAETELEEELEHFEPERLDIRLLIKLNADIAPALARVELLDRVGDNFYTRRERIDADIAYERAWRLNNLAVERWEATLEKQLASRAQSARIRKAHPGQQKPRTRREKATRVRSRMRRRRSLSAIMEL
jgi:hypothetical protein